MRRIVTTVLLSAALASSAAWATNDDVNSSNQKGGSVSETYQGTDQNTDQNKDQGAQEPGTVSEEAGTASEQAGMESTRKAEDVAGAYLSDETVGIKPQVGVLTFKDPVTNDTNARAVGGLTIDMNVMKFVSVDDVNLKRIYAGPSIGAFYSHLGASDSNFFGADPSVGSPGSAGANFLLLPMNLKAGYSFGDMFRVSAHGGGNVIYRSVENSMNTDDAVVASSATRWKVYPNIGADLEFGKAIAVIIRPDVTVTPGNDIFSGTLGVNIPIG